MKMGMRKLLILAVGLFLLGTPLAALAFDADMDEADRPKGADKAIAGAKLLKFRSMAPVSGLLVGSSIIREVPGGGAPWVIGSGSGKLTAAGMLTIKVKGLVLEDSGVNPSETFGGLVSCIDADGNTANFLTTGVFAADVDGNAMISEMLPISNPCLAPIVFVTGSEGQWFAVTGGAPAAEVPDEEEPPKDQDEMELPDDMDEDQDAEEPPKVQDEMKPPKL